MGDVINLADPAFEPTDAQLEGLSARAFSEVRAAQDLALRNLREQIDVARKHALDRLGEPPAGGSAPR